MAKVGMGILSGTQATAEEQPLLSPHPGKWLKVDWLIAGALSAVVVLLPAIVSLRAGSFSIPQNDDWAYRRIAEHFSQTGHIAFTGWSPMTLVGQILWSWPFLRLLGDHGWVLGISTAVLAVIGVSCAYYVARQVLARSWAAAAVLLVAAVPGFAWSTSTFMTDVPTFAAEMACLAFGVAAIVRRGRPRWVLLGAAMAVGVFGFSIREFAIAAPVAVLLCAGSSNTRPGRYRYLAAGIVELAVCAVIYRWSTHIPGVLHETITWPSGGSIGNTVRAYFTLALVLSPAVALAAWRRLRWRVTRGAAVAVVVFMAGVVADLHYQSLFVGNYLSQQGFAGSAILVGGRPTLLPRPLWHLLTGVGLLSGGLLAGIAFTVDRKALGRWRSWVWAAPPVLLSVYGTLTAAGLAIYALTATSFFDRYLWPLAFAVGVLLLRGRQRQPKSKRPPAVTGVVVALSGLLVVVTVALTVNADTYGAARWHAGQVAVSQGVPTREVDAGFEWVGAHATGIANTSLHPAAPPYEPWYALMEPGFRECAVVSGTPLDYPDLRLVQKSSYDLLGFTGRRTLNIYISSAVGC